MFVFHVKHTKRKLIALSVTAVAVVCAILLLPGCQSKAPQSDSILAPTVEQQVAYLTELGWEVNADPLETLELQLPDDLQADYADYCKLQNKQGFPFSQFAGQSVKRYTYTVTNYPNIDHGVQVNLYLCGEQIIAGDIISTGEGGFQTGIAYPEA